MSLSTSAIIGLDLGGSKLLLNAGEHERRLPTGPRYSPAQLLADLGTFISAHGLQPTAIGLAVPGLVTGDGTVLSCDVLPRFDGWEAAAALAALCPRLCLMNDVDAALRGEIAVSGRRGSGAVVMAGTAIGAAFSADDGRPLRGVSGWAGELGYLPLVVAGQVKRLDELAGGAAIAGACGLSATALAARAAAGDPAVLAQIARAGEFLGLGLAALINLLNPGFITAGGGCLALPGYWPAALATAQAHSLPAAWSACTLAPSRHGSRAVLVGILHAAAQNGDG